jgi:hypothetical protein
MPVPKGLQASRNYFSAVGCLFGLVSIRTLPRPERRICGESHFKRRNFYDCWRNSQPMRPRCPVAVRKERHSPLIRLISVSSVTELVFCMICSEIGAHLCAKCVRGRFELPTHGLGS